MNLDAYLVLRDGSIYKGLSFGAKRKTFGEVVFNTSMTGYQEMLTDPSYSGQIVVPTYPLIGNYGINEENNESKEIQVAGFVVRQFCDQPSHKQSSASLPEFLNEHNVPAISEVDTRSITRKIRTTGVMMGAIASEIDPHEILKELKDFPPYDEIDHVKNVSTPSIYKWDSSRKWVSEEGEKLRILVSDFGVKFNILRMLVSRGCTVEVFPSTYSAEDILARNPDGIMLSPGPGDPELLDYAVETTKSILGRIPIMGICLGNQVLGKALGGKTYKLKFGHRGSNHPVMDTTTNRIYITSQNHGYAIDPDTLNSQVFVSHISMNDETVEGIRHKSLPAMSIQYHSEASPGPIDNEYIFDQFIEMVEENK